LQAESRNLNAAHPLAAWCKTPSFRIVRDPLARSFNFVQIFHERFFAHFRFLQVFEMDSIIPKGEVMKFGFHRSNLG
jgi:hypothetical protein